MVLKFQAVIDTVLLGNASLCHDQGKRIAIAKGIFPDLGDAFRKDQAFQP